MGRKIIDIDVHFVEDLEQLAGYFDEPWKTRIKDGGKYAEWGFFPGAGSSGDRGVGGRIKREKDGEVGDVVRTSYPNSGTHPDEIKYGMDFLGVDICLVLSQLHLGTRWYSADDKRQWEFVNSSIDYMLDHVLDPKEGIYSAVPVPYQNVDESIEILDRVGNRPEFVGVYLVTSGAEPPFGNRKYDPIYEFAESNDLPVLFHTGGSGLDSYRTRGYGKFIETHILGFLEANMSQLTSLLIQGVPEKFPDLDIIFLESGVFWIGSILQRIDTEYLKRQSEAPLLDKLPSQYVQDNFHFGTQPLERPEKDRYLENAIDMIGGPDRLLYASDYPHWDFDRPNSITEIPFLSELEKEKILSKNAERVFEFE